MKHTFTLEKTEKNTILLFAPNGGVLFSFDKEVFPEIQTIRGASIAMVKQHQKKFFNLPNDEVKLIDKTNIVHEVCSECGSIDFDIKAWVSEKDGYISKPEEVEEDDCWCNKCEQHIEPEQKGGDYTLYNSTEK
jgi:hypothetical protein